MNESRIELDALDPTRDADFSARVDAIAADAMAARARRSSVTADLARWTRPALVAAALILAVTIPVLVRERSAGAGTVRGASSAEILGIPPGLIALSRTPEPSVVQLADAVGSSSTRGTP